MATTRTKRGTATKRRSMNKTGSGRRKAAKKTGTRYRSKT